MYAREMLAVSGVLRPVVTRCDLPGVCETQHRWPRETLFLPEGAALAGFGTVVTRCDLPGVYENTAEVSRETFFFPEGPALAGILGPL